MADAEGEILTLEEVSVYVKRTVCISKAEVEQAIDAVETFLALVAKK